jgi:lipopolysaccharide export LptBFGC system permease protein LptF
MGIFHLYLIRRFLRNLAIALFVLTSVQLALSGGGPPAGFLVSLFGAAIEALPLALLTAALFTLGPMARNHEITALKAGGWSLARITWPVLAVGATGVVVTASIHQAGFSFGPPAGPPGASPDLARPLACGLAVVLGIGLGVTPRAATRFAGFLTALGVLFAFYLVTATFQALGRHGGLPPMVGRWGATIIFGLVALVLFRRADK